MFKFALVILLIALVGVSAFSPRMVAMKKYDISAESKSVLYAEKKAKPVKAEKKSKKPAAKKDMT